MTLVAMIVGGGLIGWIASSWVDTEPPSGGPKAHLLPSFAIPRR